MAGRTLASTTTQDLRLSLSLTALHHIWSCGFFLPLFLSLSLSPFVSLSLSLAPQSTDTHADVVQEVNGRSYTQSNNISSAWSPSPRRRRRGKRSLQSQQQQCHTCGPSSPPNQPPLFTAVLCYGEADLLSALCLSVSAFRFLFFFPSCGFSCLALWRHMWARWCFLLDLTLALLYLAHTRRSTTGMGKLRPGGLPSAIEARVMSCNC